MTQHIRAINGVVIEAVLAESHSFGDQWFESLATGLRRMNEVELSGFYDDTASTGPDAIFNAVASGPGEATRTLKLTWGGTKTTSVETLIRNYERRASVGNLTEFTVRLQPTGAVTET
jgi:hypothetical protein